MIESDIWLEEIEKGRQSESGRDEEHQVFLFEEEKNPEQSQKCQNEKSVEEKSEPRLLCMVSVTAVSWRRPPNLNSALPIIL